MLARHDLIWLDNAAWQRVLAQMVDTRAEEDPVPRQCLRHWAVHQLPLVVARQPAGWSGQDAGESTTLGLAAPSCWGRRRLTISAQIADISRSGSFPAASAAAQNLPASLHAAWTSLCGDIEALGARAKVYGSHGWQILTGLAYLRAGSDVDLLLTVDSAQQADAVARLLGSAAIESPRIDGEFSFPDGAAVAWREWAAWRAGAVDQVLVKRLHGPGLECARSWAVA